MFAEALARRRRRGLEEVVRALCLVGNPAAHQALVGEVLEETRLTLADLRGRLGFVPGSYSRAVLHRSEHFEAMLLAWDRGARSPVHGHDGQRCWFKPVQGAFTLEDYDLCAGGELPGVAELQLRSVRRCGGPAAAVETKHPEDDIHRVTLSENEAFGVTLHVYARPISSCLVYDPVRLSCFQRSLNDSDPDALVGRRRLQLQRLAARLGPQGLLAPLRNLWAPRRTPRPAA